VAREEDPSFLDMARVVVILIHPVARYAATLDIQLHTVLIVIQRLLTLPTLLNPSLTAFYLTQQLIGILILKLLHI
jgi:hypothetical protein